MSAASSDTELTERFRPVFARIAEGTLERERSRLLPFEPIDWLREAGFVALRVPLGRLRPADDRKRHHGVRCRTR
ncbi:hypothetical protein [Glaciihabitans sp. UYNi722]|uniref:hypothetical protein n=1 Tax=Glaciihabitans sp. UYNi722 TaxID=3156344 RepID=UPI003390F80A